MSAEAVISGPLRVFLNHVYEYKKGVRSMVLMTLSRRNLDYATHRLQSQKIDYHVQELCAERVNLYFGRSECLAAVRIIASKPVGQLSPEEDFILGTLLGYDVCQECERYCMLKHRERGTVRQAAI